MDPETLESRISDLTAALGDPTRRAIYMTVRASAEPLTTAEVASRFGIHPNVARHHLDRLAEDGYLEAAQRRPEGRTGPGAGRPAKTYRATAKEVSVHFTPRRLDLLVEMLVSIIDEVGKEDLARVAERVGRSYGERIVSEMGRPEDPGYAEVVEAVAVAMGRLGFEVDPDVRGRRLVTSHCPFGETATSHPEVICSLDRGIVTGMLGALSHPCQPVVLPHRHLADDCITKVPVSIG